MRAFISVEVPKEVKDYLYELQKRIDGNDIKVKWVSKKNLHLTLKFMLNISEEDLEKVKDKLKEVKFSKFKLKLGGLGSFPGDRRINVIWVGIKEDKELVKLQTKVDEVLVDIFPSEQNFSSHLTLGRVKAFKNKDKFLKRFKEIKIESLEFEVNEFLLMKSELTKDGPIYSVIEEYSLK